MKAGSSIRTGPSQLEQVGPGTPEGHSLSQLCSLSTSSLSPGQCWPPSPSPLRAVAGSLLACLSPAPGLCPVGQCTTGKPDGALESSKSGLGANLQYIHTETGEILQLGRPEGSRWSQEDCLEEGPLQLDFKAHQGLRHRGWDGGHATCQACQIPGTSTTEAGRGWGRSWRELHPAPQVKECMDSEHHRMRLWPWAPPAALGCSH